MTHRKTPPIDENIPALQFNTRISLRLRQSLNDYLIYIQTNDPGDLPPETEDWPRNLTALINEALEIWLAEHPRRFRKGPRPDQLVPKEKE